MATFKLPEYNPAVSSSMIHTLMSENELLRNHVGELNQVIFNLTEELNNVRGVIPAWEPHVTEEEYASIVRQ
jgi:hypothetical protein